MLILTRADVAALLTMTDALAAVEEGFRRLALGEVVMPQRAATAIMPPLGVEKGLHLSMPAFVAGDPGALTVKVVTVYGQNPARYGLPTIQGVLLLHDARTGQFLALMDAEELTAVRTGAASGVATKYLARADAGTVTIFGAGAQAGPQLAAVCAVRPIERALVVTRSGVKDDAFCTQMAAALGIEVTATRDVRLAVQEADIICTATNATTPIFDGSWLQPGTHLNAIGAYNAAMRELDTVAVRRSRVYIDHHPAAQAEAGDLLIPVANGEWTYDQVVGSLGEIVIGKVGGRDTDGDITLFKSVGLAVQDALTAAQVYARAVERGVGREIVLS